ncbi:hypothetical protein [Candidatus Nitrospira bockiana]
MQIEDVPNRILALESAVESLRAEIRALTKPEGPSAPATPPLEMQAQWETNLLAYGRVHGADLLAAEPFLNYTEPQMYAWRADHTYYDGLWVFLQIAQRAGPDPWQLYVAEAVVLYRDNYVLKHQGKVAGYWNFGRGLYEHWRAYDDPQSREALLLLARNGLYGHGDLRSTENPSPTVPNQPGSREVAYNALTQILAINVGYGDDQQIDRLCEQILRHFDQWFVERTAAYVRPFMVALSARSLITACKYGFLPRNRVSSVLTLACDELWETCWDDAARAMRYTDRPDPDGSHQGGTDPKPDLNLLIAPMYGWVYQETQDVRHRERGDALFNSGVRQSAWLADRRAYKQFNQAYLWSADYLIWRGR